MIVRRQIKVVENTTIEEASVRYAPGIDIKFLKTDRTQDQDSPLNIQETQTITDDELLVRVILDLNPTTRFDPLRIKDVRREVNARREDDLPWDERKIRRLLEKNGIGTYYYEINCSPRVLKQLAKKYGIKWPKSRKEIATISILSTYLTKPKKEADKEEYNYRLFD